MTVLNDISVFMATSLSGSFLTISVSILASMATIPGSSISPSITVSIPNSVLFAVSFIPYPVASTRIHSSIAIVVFVGTAFDTVLTPFNNSDLEQVNFIMCINLLSAHIYKYI